MSGSMRGRSGMRGRSHACGRSLGGVKPLHPDLITSMPWNKTTETPPAKAPDAAEPAGVLRHPPGSR